MEILATIDNMACSLVMDGQASLDANRIREDLMGLYSDILSALERKAPGKEKQIYDYAALLQKELDLYTPHKAFEAGAILGCTSESFDGDIKSAFMLYIKRIEFDPASKAIHGMVHAQFDELCKLLGDERGLIAEFTELYRSCNGIIQSKIDRFFDMGYKLTYSRTSSTCA